MTVEILCAPPVREVTEVKYQNASDDSLSEFAKCAVAMRNVLLSRQVIRAGGVSIRLERTLPRLRDDLSGGNEDPEM